MVETSLCKNLQIERANFYFFVASFYTGLISNGKENRDVFL